MNLLSGLLVLDLADEKASFGAKLLADTGARVIKIEKPGGDSARWTGPFHENEPHPEKSLSFWYNNTNKLGITLNLESSEGKSLFFRLVQKADAIIETYPPGYLKTLGLDYEVLSRQNPRLILTSVTGFGQTGPYKSYKSHDIVASAAGGQMYVSGSKDSPPLQSYGRQSYCAASICAATGILIALQERNQRGQGQHLDISLQEAVAATLEHVLVRYFYDKVGPVREGSRHWSQTAAILPSRNGYLFLTFNREWQSLIELLEAEGMAADLKEEKWQDQNYRQQHSDHIVKVLSQWTRTHNTSELFEIGQLMRFPWAPVCSPQQVFESQQLRERNFFVPVLHREANTSFTYPGSAFKLTGEPGEETKRAPLIGEHNMQVYKEEMGLPLTEIARLRELKVI